MIKSFNHKRLKRLYEKDDTSGIGADILATVREVLTVLDAANGPQGIALPGYGLHQFTGKQKGYWSVALNKNWRIIFRFGDGNACDVELIDYH